MALLHVLRECCTPGGTGVRASMDSLCPLLQPLASWFPGQQPESQPAELGGADGWVQGQGWGEVLDAGKQSCEK